MTDPSGSSSDATARVERSDDEWKAQLTPEQFQVARQGGTERAFTGAYWDNKATGMYHCVCCGAPLFSSATKFDSGTGWPSFWNGVTPEAITTKTDVSHGMVRTEVRSLHGDSHLGHVFPDGPRDRGGLRYCINSASLRFVHRDDMEGEGYGAYLDQVEDIT